jgi:hypothetical protein
MATLDPNARTTVPLVKEIIETDLADSIINSFINSAHYLVQAKLVDTEAGLSASQLADIEMYLAAHFMAISRERQVESEAVGGEWQAKYQGKTDMNLQATLYGQQALLMDTSGKLATLGKQRATFKVFTA